MRRSQRSSPLRCFVCHAVPFIASTDPRASRWEPIRRQEPARRIVTLNSRVQHGAEGSPGHRSCFALGACLLAPDFKSVRPDRAMGMGYKVMSTWVEVAVDE